MEKKESDQRRLGHSQGERPHHQDGIEINSLPTQRKKQIGGNEIGLYYLQKGPLLSQGWNGDYFQNESVDRMMIFSFLQYELSRMNRNQV